MTKSEREDEGPTSLRQRSPESINGSKSCQRKWIQFKSRSVLCPTGQQDFSRIVQWIHVMNDPVRFTFRSVSDANSSDTLWQFAFVRQDELAYESNIFFEVLTSWKSSLKMKKKYSTFM